MKKIFFGISIILILAVVYLMILNHGHTVDVNYLRSYFYTMSPENPYAAISMRLSVYTFLILTAGIASGVGIMMPFMGILTDKVLAYRRELEKSTVSKEASASRVEVLEAKIKTLDKAFTYVTDERTKLELQIKELNSELASLNNKRKSYGDK